jgi:hypothetical protein
MLAHCYRENESFRLREKLQSAIPEHATEDLQVYAAANVAGVCRNSLVYFGASVFWRAAVHTWAIPMTSTSVRIDLGPYEDDLRRFLLNEGTLPENIVMSVRISSLASLLEVATLPQSRTVNGYHVHDFTIPGVAFALLVGSGIPREYRRFCTARSPEEFVFLSRELDSEFVQFMARIGGMYR